MTIQTRWSVLRLKWMRTPGEVLHQSVWPEYYLEF
jgi:hypothetical protein